MARGEDAQEAVVGDEKQWPFITGAGRQWLPIINDCINWQMKMSVYKLQLKVWDGVEGRRGVELLRTHFLIMFH